MNTATLEPQPLYKVWMEHYDKNKAKQPVNQKMLFASRRIFDCLKTSKTPEHIAVCRQMIENFKRLYKNEDLMWATIGGVITFWAVRKALIEKNIA